MVPTLTLPELIATLTDTPGRSTRKPLLLFEASSFTKHTSTAVSGERVVVVILAVLMKNPDGVSGWVPLVPPYPGAVTVMVAVGCEASPASACIDHDATFCPAGTVTSSVPVPTLVELFGASNSFVGSLETRCTTRPPAGAGALSDTLKEFSCESLPIAKFGKL